ncbi:MAG: tetratricopeptide repeat protein [candidate division Zixibacteria bacterium]|nr:tetratricopeptide repeat protein [candidate division Zixibacteria bacterium]
MRLEQAILFFLVVVPLFLFGCAVSSYSEGDRLLKRGDYNEAVPYFRAALAENPEKVEIWRKLGIAQFHLERYDEAMRAFKQASLLDTDDSRSIIYRGMIHEKLGEFDQARRLYTSYLSFAADKELRKEVRRRLRWLEDDRLQRVISEALANEENLDIAQIPRNSVAVVRFDAADLTGPYSVLGRGIAELINHDLSYVEGLTLVERIHLSRLRDELDLSESEFADKLNSPRVGKLVGAAKIITGRLEIVGAKVIYIDCNIVDVGPGLTEYPEPLEDKVKKFFELQKKLTLDIITKLGYEITPDIKSEIDVIPTESFLALIAYSRGLDYADRGLYSLAEAEFNAALAEDPNFSMAAEALHDYSDLSGYDGKLRPAAAVVALLDAQVEAQDRTKDNRGEIIGRLQGKSRIGVPEGDNPYVTPEIGGGKIVVTGRTDPE